MDKVTAILRKLAAWEYERVPQVQMAQALGLTEGRVSQVLASAAYKSVYQEYVGERVKEDAETDSGWDRIERLAVANVSRALEKTHDPEFSLKAATLANRAVRRHKANHPLDPQGQGSTVILQLPAAMLERYTERRQLADGTTVEREYLRTGQKDKQVLGHGQFEKLVRDQSGMQSIADVMEEGDVNLGTLDEQ
jgi:hypothetical protein